MKILVLGAGGFIGGHIARNMAAQGHEVVGVDIKPKPDYPLPGVDYVASDLRVAANVKTLMLWKNWDEVYQLAAEMGGAGFIFTGEHDADVMVHSSLINLNTIGAAKVRPPKKIFYSSSACVYKEDPSNPMCAEASAYPAEPDSPYGWEKLFSENLYASAARNYGLNIRIARFHNIFGPLGTWRGGREKAPAAIMRKVAEAEVGGTIEIWGNGRQTRSFMYIDECLEAVRRLMDSDVVAPTNIGSAEMVSINVLVDMVANIANKHVYVDHVNGPLGVNGRCSDNRLIYQRLGWKPTMTLQDGLRETYPWINEQVQQWKS